MLEKNSQVRQIDRQADRCPPPAKEFGIDTHSWNVEEKFLGQIDRQIDRKMYLPLRSLVLIHILGMLEKNSQVRQIDRQTDRQKDRQADRLKDVPPATEFGIDTQHKSGMWKKNMVGWGG